jgi:hypothetical protein
VEWFIDGETGLPAEAAEKLKKLVRRTEEGAVIASTLEVTSSAVKPLTPIRLGTSDNFFTDIVSENITIPSKKQAKEEIREVDVNALAAVSLPPPRKYIRRGREELGFIVEEMPSEVRTSQGDIDLKALIAVLAAKVWRLEERVFGGGGM